MAASPELKVYDSSGKYQAACKEIAAAVSLVRFYGQGSTIRHRHGFIAWTEGKDGDSFAIGILETEKLIIDRLFDHYNPPKKFDPCDDYYNCEIRAYSL
jgi:hypothetical protein